MKVIKYYLYDSRNYGTEEEPELVGELLPVIMEWNEANEEIAKTEAYNGKYTIEDDGQPEQSTEATMDDVLNTLLGVV